VDIGSPWDQRTYSYLQPSLRIEDSKNIVFKKEEIMSKDDTEPAAVTDSEAGVGDFTNTKDFDPALNPEADQLPATEEEAERTPAIEPFIVPLDVRRSQRRDTFLFAASAIVAILSISAAFGFGQLLTESASQIANIFLIVGAVGLVATFVFALFLLLDTTKGQRYYNASTRQWVSEHYGLDLSNHKIKAMGRGRVRATGSTAWHAVPLEGHRGGVKIVYSKEQGYRLMTERDGNEVEMSRVGAV
jgi:hypothetical protein